MQSFFRSVPTIRQVSSNNRGSLLVAATFFLLLFLFIAALGVDTTRRYMKEQKLQAIADGAVKAGGQAFNQFSGTPNLDRVRNAMFDYIRRRQSSEYLDLYDVESDTYGHGFAIRSLHPPSTNNTCTQGFSIHNGQLITTQPGTFKTVILGSALASDESLAPVTTRLNIDRRTLPDTTVESWGSFADPDDGNVNVSGNPDAAGGADWGPADSPMDPMSLQSGETVVVDAQSWWDFDGDGSPESYVQDSSRMQEDGTDGIDYSITLSNGDELPEYVIEAGYNQPGTAEFFEPYIDSDGTIDLKQNQALVLFDLDQMDHDYNGAFNVDHTNVDGREQTIGDYQDLIMLVTFAPQSRTSASNYYPAKSQGTQSSPCPPYPVGSHKIGITVYGKSHHLFLPNFVREEQALGLQQSSVALVTPQPLFQTSDGIMSCGVYSWGPLEGSSDSFGSEDANLCAMANVSLDNPIGGGHPGMIYAPEDVTIEDEVHYSIKRITISPSPPEFQSDSPGDYDVTLTESSFLGWDPNSCDAVDTHVREVPGLEWDGPGPPGSGTVCVERDNSGDYLIDRPQPGVLQASDGSRVSIYTDGSFVLVGNNKTIHGALYAEGDIVLESTNLTVEGDPGLLGGLALWSEQGIMINGDNVLVNGILGGEGSVEIDGSNFTLNGLLFSGGMLEMNDTADLDHDPSKYDPAAIKNVPWISHKQNTNDRPLYSNVKVNLIK